MAPPIKLKQSSNSTAQTLTSTTSSQDARLLVRETLRISANLASAPAPATAPADPPSSGVSVSSRKLRIGLEDEFVESSLRLICCEEIDGRKWKYVAENDGFGKFKKNSFRSVSLQSPQAPVEELMSFVRSYVVPEGFPDSVIPSYVPYMTWRALKHFFGGAMGVFTTKTLLSSVGVSKNTAIPGAVAINWILKDGAGRVGKMLFARQGKKFDCDLKQLRFAGDLLMELGAGVELATATVPHLFLPLACAANVAKNVAAVTSTSTRTPIYKAFAKGENIGDVTAKGECVGNLADLLGTGLSIMISKRNPSLVTTFALLSCGYVFSSYQEVKSVVLHTLNRARFSVAVESFLKTGRVPSLQEGNSRENIFTLPWLKERPIVLGPRFKDAFQDPSAYLAIEPLFEKERYIVTYNPTKDKVYALFKDQAKPDDILKAAFHAHVLLHFINSSNRRPYSSSKQQKNENSNYLLSANYLEAHIAESCKMVSSLYGSFKSKTAEQGWRMSDSLLNPGRARLVLNS
ncbi:protein root UVB sensitive 6 [Mercurialis annua]|uniref:protein root UVB sensitive 6 n=1 Tax=Mercurialis annua TaxID=3986 RepID=UPI00215F03E6|nr:protein root UVB sensitive 6 [Mercurialis annua]